MSIYRWLGKKFGLVSDFWAQWYGGDDDTNENVTPETALNLSAWFSGVRLITETIATLPGGMLQKQPNGDRSPAPGHPLDELLRGQPNDDQTSVEFWEGRVGPLVMVGNSFAEKKFIGSRLVAIDRMPFRDVKPERKDDGRLIYAFTDRGKREELPADKVFHIRGFGMDGDLGLSPLGYARRSIGGALATERAAARVYSKGMRASGLFTVPLDMDKEQRKQFLQNYVEPLEGAKGEGKSLILPPGFNWQQMNIAPKDAEMLLSRSFNVADVCRWLGIPPILVGHAAEGQTMWGSGVEQIILGWLVLGLRAYLKRIEAAVNVRLVTREDRAKGYFFEFNFEGLLRADSAGRAALMSSFSQNGLRTRNELRRLDNYPAMPGGDELTAQSNLMPLAKLGETVANANAVRNTLRTWLLELSDEEKRAA